MKMTKISKLTLILDHNLTFFDVASIDVLIYFKFSFSFSKNVNLFLALVEILIYFQF